VPQVFENVVRFVPAACTVQTRDRKQESGVEAGSDAPSPCPRPCK
jgi:hypothetical protein